MKLLTLILSLSLVISGTIIYFEPEISKATTANDAVTITQIVSDELTISDCVNFTMTGTIAGITGGTSNGSCTWTVETNNDAGFTMAIKAGSMPALATGGYSFADYTPAVSTTPDYDWSVAVSASEFGYTVEPATAGDTNVKFLDNGSNLCNIAGSTNGADTCWYKLTTADQTIISRGSKTGSSGEAEVVKFKATVGATANQQDGTYTATVTATVTTL
jgi:hypothetical protein